MTNKTNTIQIITGTSYFSGAPVVGVAFKGDNDGVAFTKWADKVGKGGRPSTVRMSRESEADAIARLIQDFQDWAVRSGLAIVLDKNVRRNVGAF